MAYIQEKVKGKKIVSFKFKACMGRDLGGKQIFKCKTWYPPADLTPAKARKEAQKVAGVWEEEAKQAYLKEQEEKAVAGELLPPAPVYTFDSFVNEVRIPLCVRDGSHRPATVAMYTNILKIILPQFKGVPLAEISGVRISQYLRWLRNEYRKPNGKPLAEKSIKHHYNVLNLIFGFAEKQDIIQKNPMKKVDPPKVSKREVDALTEDEAIRFFNALLICDFEFRCILQVLITTGLRRGECLGLQWTDIDFQNATLTVNRSTTYTPECGITVAQPKTAHSVRTIPVVPSTLALLKQLQKQQEREHPAKLFDDYIHDMKIIQHFATLNRKAMIDVILVGMRLTAVEQFTTIHNYIDTNNMILRKGAVAAYAGQKLLIPINMRDGSLICIGKGNPDWNCSAPHGAGRLMSRKEAFNRLSLDEYCKEMEGIYTTCVDRTTLDEAPMAYKGIDEIISHIGPTVEIMERIIPVYNFKAAE